MSVEVRLDEKGNVSDARVLSGPDEFRKAVLQSVLSWHFPPDAAGSAKVVNVQFHTPADSGKVVAPVREPDDSYVRPDVETTTQFLEDTLRQIQTKLDQVRAQPGNDPDAISLRDAQIKIGEHEIQTLKARIALHQAAQSLQSSRPIAQVSQGKVIRKISLVGIDIPLAEFLAQAQLPVHEGDLLTPGSAESTIAAVKKFDEHLTVLADVIDPNGVELTISPLNARAERAAAQKITDDEIRAYAQKVAAAQPAQAAPLALLGFGPVPSVLEGRIVRTIRLSGLGMSLDDFLAQAQLPIREGDRLTRSLAEAIVASVKKFDEHLNVFWTTRIGDNDAIEIVIAPAGAGFVVLGGGTGRGAGGAAFPEAASSTNSGVSPPVPIYQPAPDYTAEAKNAKWQGTVLLSILVDETGKVTEEKVVRSLGMGLDQKAVEKVSQWRFKPGTKNGQPVAVRANIEVNFRLP